MIRTLSTLLVLFGIYSVYGQSSIRQNKTFNCDEIRKANDFENALISDRTYKITLNCSPLGSGKVKEVQSGGNSKLYFKDEHNIVWVQFIAIKKSKLGINIKPNSSKDDYDFLLFKDAGDGTKQKIQSKQLKPLRTNIARTQNVKDGSTGLKFDSEHSFVGSGINVSYSQYIEVEQGDVYYLAIDNVYDGGEGAVITLDYFKTKTIEGYVQNDEKKAIPAEVIWENITTGEELVKTTTDPITGTFEMTVPFNSNPSNKYVLSATADDHIFSEVSYTPGEIASCEPVPIQMVLTELKKGNKTSLQNINFVGNEAIFLESAYPSLKRLRRLMKKNPTLIIHIEGHTNGCSNGVNFSQILSENRARVSKEYLIEAGIAANRITTEGLNCRYMLYAEDSSEKQQSMNRRIEVLVKDY